MSDQTPEELRGGVPEASPHATLHLLPTAPQELIMEVYWHLVGQLKAEGKDRPNARRALDDLNEAYRAVMTRPDQDGYDSPAEVTRSGHDAASRSRGAWPVRYFRRPQREKVRSQGSPWELLHLDPGAPPGVVDLAFGFWHQRLRTSSADSTAPNLEELENAYRLVRSAQPDEPPERDDEEAAVATTAIESGEGDEEQAPVSAIRRVQLAVAGMFATLRPHTEATRPLSPPETTIPADAPAAEGLDAVRSSEQAASQAEESLDETDEETVHAPEDETVAARGVPEFLARDVSSQEAGSAPDAEVPFIAGETGEQERSGERPEETGLEVAAMEEPPQLSVESKHGVPPPSTEPGVAQSPAPGTISPDAQARLIPESATIPTSEVVIRQEPISLGTSPTCDVVFTAPNSRERQVEARIWRQHGRFMFHNIGSASSVLVNGQAITWVVLEHGDRLQIGDDVFRFQVSQDGAIR